MGGGDEEKVVELLEKQPRVRRTCTHIYDRSTHPLMERPIDSSIDLRQSLINTSQNIRPEQQVQHMLPFSLCFGKGSQVPHGRAFLRFCKFGTMQVGGSCLESCGHIYISSVHITHTHTYAVHRPQAHLHAHRADPPRLRALWGRVFCAQPLLGLPGMYKYHVMGHICPRRRI